jgi:hypothetical protein
VFIPEIGIKGMSTTGFIAAAAAVFSFGSNLVPVKQVDTHDGIFFQSVFCSAIMASGLFVQLIRGSPQFQPLAMVGGVLWAIGNVLTIPISRLNFKAYFKVVS